MRDFAIYGVGELGKLFGAAALSRGLRVTPITRSAPAAQVLQSLPSDAPLLISVGEDALQHVLASLPHERRPHAILLQNELFPSTWRELGAAPTVLVPWVLQKRGTPTLAVRSTPVFGRHSALILELLRAAELPCEELADEAQLAEALAQKYAFILTINALGLAVDRTLGTWLQEEPAQVWDICEEAITLSEALAGRPIERARAHAITQEAMRAMSHVPARGRTARERVERALGHAAGIGLTLPRLARVAQPER